MFDSRQARSAVRAVVVVSVVSAAMGACASGGEGSGPSPFTSSGPPQVLSSASADAATTGAAASQSSTSMADGCADVTEAGRAATRSGAPVGAPSQGEPTMSGEDASSEEASSEDASDEDASMEDASSEDATEDTLDEDADDGGPPWTVGTLPPLPMPGDLVITEIMFQPSGPEPESEWFEVYNQTSSPVLLSGLTIQDGYLDTQVIASSPVVVAQPGEYLLLVRSISGAQEAQLPSASILYAYGTGVPDDAGIELDAGPFGELTLLNGQTVLADVPYGQWGVSAPGQSIELGTSATTQSDPSGWCLAENPWAPGSDDGTPGAPSDCQ
jgi:hypothetical protein